jgi:hypothetical protein
MASIYCNTFTFANKELSTVFTFTYFVIFIIQNDIHFYIYKEKKKEK